MFLRREKSAAHFCLSCGLLSSYTMQGKFVLTFWMKMLVYLQAAGLTGEGKISVKDHLNKIQSI